MSTGVCLNLCEFVFSATLSHLRCIKYLRQHNELQVRALVRAEWRAGHLLFVVWRQRERAARELKQRLATAQRLARVYSLFSKALRSPSHKNKLQTKLFSFLSFLFFHLLARALIIVHY